MRRRASASPPLSLPTDPPRRPAQAFQSSAQPIPLSGQLAAELRTLAKREGVTILVTLLAAFEALLVRYGNPSGVLVGASVRSDPPRTFLLHTDVSDDPTFSDLLARVRDETREAMEHAELSLEQMAEALALDHAAGLPPTPQAMLVLQERATVPSSEHASPGLVVTPAVTDHPDCDLALWVSETADGFSGTLRYDTDLFERATIVRMAGHLRTLLEGVVADPHVSLSAVQVLTEAERHRLLVEWK